MPFPTIEGLAEVASIRGGDGEAPRYIPCNMKGKILSITKKIISSSVVYVLHVGVTWSSYCLFEFKQSNSYCLRNFPFCLWNKFIFLWYLGSALKNILGGFIGYVLMVILFNLFFQMLKNTMMMIGCHHGIMEVCLIASMMMDMLIVMWKTWTFWCLSLVRFACGLSTFFNRFRSVAAILIV